MERAQHARDVAHRRALQAALAERPRGLALEVDDDEVAPRPQHLAEVVVAVGADAAAQKRAVEQPAHARQRRLIAGLDPLELGHAGARAPRRGQHLPDQRPQRLVQRPLLQGRERLGGERGIVGRRRERDVHLAGALAQQAGELEVGADRVGHVGRQIVSGELDQPDGGHRGRARLLAGERALEEPHELVERVLPGIALVGDEPLQEADRDRLPAAAVILDRARRGRHVREARAGEQAGQLDLGVRARLDPPEHLQHRPLAERDRAVGLLGAERRGIELGAVAHQPAQLARAPGGQRADPAAEPPPAAHELQERRRQHAVIRAVEQRQPALAASRRIATVAALGGRPSSLCGAGDERQDVGVGLALGVLDAHQAQVPGLAPAGAGAGDAHLVGQRHAPDPARLAREPAPSRQEGGHGIVELAAGAALEDGRPAAGDAGSRAADRRCRRRRAAAGCSTNQ